MSKKRSLFDSYMKLAKRIVAWKKMNNRYRGQNEKWQKRKTQQNGVIRLKIAFPYRVLKHYFRGRGISSPFLQLRGMIEKHNL